jgi:TRAP-type C4-dicarboxylate transport system permease small subunit
MVTKDKTSLAPAPAVRVAQIAAATARMLLGAVLIGMVLLNVVNAIGRYVFGAVFVGADELLVFAMIWLVMTGMLLVTAERGHIALDFLVHRVEPKTRIALAVLHNLIMFVASAYAARQSFAFVERIGTLGQTSMGLGIPMVIPHAALIVGFGGTALVSLLLLIGDVLALISRRPMAGKQRR